MKGKWTGKGSGQMKGKAGKGKKRGPRGTGVWYKGNEIMGYDVDPDQGPRLAMSRFSLWQREVAHEYTRESWQFETPETREGWTFFDDAAHDILDSMWQENESGGDPVVREYDNHGWTYLFIMDGNKYLPNTFERDDEETIVGVQMSVHRHSAGKKRRIRFVD